MTTFRFIIIKAVQVIFVYLTACMVFSSSGMLRYTHSHQEPVTRTTKLEDAQNGKTIQKKTISGISFYRTLFLISDKMLRLTSVRECGNTENTIIRIGGQLSTVVNEPLFKNCSYPFLCDYVGFLGEGALTEWKEPDIFPETAEILDRNGEWKLIEFINARVTASKPHKLGVCVQPTYLLADWTIVARFFEVWLAQGATLFIFYVQSLSAEVAEMLRLYVEDGKMSGYVIKIIAWSSFPDRRNDSSSANRNSIRFEVRTAVNDCLMRARGLTEYLSASDLDEMIFSMSENQSLLKFMDSQFHTTAATKLSALHIRHCSATTNVNWADFTHPTQLPFLHLASITISKKVWPQGVRSKVIVIPEGVRILDIHDVYQREKPWLPPRVMDTSRVRLFHFREVALDSNATMEESDVASRFAHSSDTAYKERMKRFQLSKGVTSRQGNNDLPWKVKDTLQVSISEPVWPNRGKKVINEIEECFTNKYGQWDILHLGCPTHWECRTLTSFPYSEWVEANDQWVAIGPF